MGPIEQVQTLARRAAADARHARQADVVTRREVWDAIQAHLPGLEEIMRTLAWERCSSVRVQYRDQVWEWREPRPRMALQPRQPAKPDDAALSPPFVASPDPEPRPGPHPQQPPPAGDEGQMGLLASRSGPRMGP